MAADAAHAPHRHSKPNHRAYYQQLISVTLEGDYNSGPARAGWKIALADAVRLSKRLIRRMNSFDTGLTAHWRGTFIYKCTDGRIESAPAADMKVAGQWRY
jgi:hypothetical protein